MSSFLRDVLTDKTDQEEKIETIKKEIKKLKSVINEFMKDKYSELEPHLKPDEILLSKSDKLLHEIKGLQTSINDQVKVKLSSSSTALHSLSDELKEYNYSLQLSSQLLQIQNCFEAIQNFKNNDTQYSKAAVYLVTLHSLVIEKSAEIQALQIYQPIKEEYYKVYDNFIEEMIDLWDENVNWNEGKRIVNNKLIALSIQCDYEQLKDIIQALYNIHRLKKCAEAFAKKLLLDFIEPIIHCECKVEESNNTFSLEVLDKKKLPTHKTVLHNLKLLFKFLHEHFDIFVENDEYFLVNLSTLLFEDFSNMLTNDCISKIIPTSTSELESFAYIVSEIEDFQNTLVEIKFINEEQKFLSKYTSDIDRLYIDKKCEKLLEAARTIMKKDLHDSFKYKPDDLEEFGNDDKATNNIAIDRKLNKYIFHLPECQISKSAQEILHLVEEILEEACQTSDKYALRLFYTSRNIFEMYAALVPEIHKSFLETIPQQVALFHNSCFYLAHYLLTLSHKYKTKMPVNIQSISILYVDQALFLRKVGSEYFLNHMKYQRDIILSILRESGLSSIGQMPALPKTTERALRQCIRQFELLKTVWIEILPIKVYCRTLGCIVNDMADDLCIKLTSVEDIPADIASELVILFNLVVKRIPDIFPEPVLIEQHVQKWRKLKELILILGGSLKEIEERWADGKGPLANEFAPQHVKQLIRALFQNTEKRSNLLSKIKEK